MKVSIFYTIWFLSNTTFAVILLIFKRNEWQNTLVFKEKNIICDLIQCSILNWFEFIFFVIVPLFVPLIHFIILIISVKSFSINLTATNLADSNSPMLLSDVSHINLKSIDTIANTSNDDNSSYSLTNHSTVVNSYKFVTCFYIIFALSQYVNWIFLGTLTEAASHHFTLHDILDFHSISVTA